MKIYNDITKPIDIKNAVVTTGSFDGVHIGHSVILNRIKEIAKTINGESVIITFHPHPRLVLYPETQGNNLKLINTQKEKISLLNKSGIDHLIIIPFTLEFSQLTPKQFTEQILVNTLHAKKVVIGFNHHFGHNQEGDYSMLAQLGNQHGFNYEEIPQQEIEHEIISSTKIRKALLEGNIQRANAYLDHEYMIISKIQAGNQHFQTLGFATYNVIIEEQTKLIPPAGIYAISIRENNYYSKGIALIDENNQIDIHPFESTSNINIQNDIKILFYKQIAKDLNINNLNELKYMITSTIDFAKELIY